ncbi:MAG: hypothetical protein HZC41_11055 [Chloroflexi bacterium]|nr:hypothetical protein [Chloroflexota bacterium]
MNASRPNMRMLLIVGLIVIVGALFIIPRLGSGVAGDQSGGVQDTNPVLPTLDRSGNTGSSGTTNTSNVQLGPVVAAASVDRDGCPVDATNTFEPVEQVYIVAENSYVPAGTSVFVRLYQNGQPIEDAPEITADQDYNNSCVNFVFEPETGARFEPGQYEAEFIVNGNPVNSVQFQIR